MFIVTNQMPFSPTKEKLERICLTIIEWGVYLALFSPLIFIRNYFFPFVAPKTIFFRLIIDVVFIAYLILAVSIPKYRPKITPLSLAIAAFLAIFFLTAIFGVSFQRSFWSVFERMTGLLTFLHLFAFYVVLTAVFTERKQWEKILFVSIVAALVICFYALLAKDPLTRGGGTLGNSSFLSSYLLFNIFFAAILMVSKAGLWRVVSGVALAIFLFVLFFNPVTVTKGVVSALLIGAVLLGTGYMFFSQNRLLKKLAAPFFILMVVAGVLIVKSYHFQDRPFNLLQIPDRSRQIVWSVGWQAWQERFWFGWGWENFNVPFAKHYDPELPRTADIWYDRVHNVVLDMGVSSGVVGLLSYLSIFFFAALGLLRRAKADARGNFVPLALVALLIAYFLQNLWVFDMISSYLMFFLALAFIGFMISSQETDQTKLKTVPLSPFVAAVLIILTVFVFFIGNIQPARASKAILRGLALPLEQSLPAFQSAFKLSPMVKFEGPEQLSFRITGLLSQDNLNKELLRQGLQLAEQEFKKAIERNPSDFRMYLFLGRHYNYFYSFDNDQKKLDKADESLMRAMELSPANQQVYLNFAQLRFLQGRDEEALDFLKKARDLEPLFFGVRWHLLRGYKLAGKYDLALAELKELELAGLDWWEILETLREGIEILEKTGEELSVLVPLYEKGVQLNPQDIALWEKLVNGYIGLGEVEKAKTAAEKLREIRPEFAPQVEQLLKQMGF
ncbi:MAG: hypothetical protein G01um101430_340 [Parcubacteria group bacterium Gr01-1014_30]|nr:MAG: hypothetical protein G01um101430_340 [Parcubacteria group bacterium Gr01-1014_30]